METNAAVEIAKAIVAAQPPAIPIAVQITGMIIGAVSPLILGMVLWLQNNKLGKVEKVTDATHIIVNSQRTEMQESIKKLEAESKVSAAAAAEAVAERRMSEMNAANQAALREAIIEASKIAASERAPALPVAVSGDPKTIVAEKIVAEKIVTSDDIDAEHPLIKQLREALQQSKSKGTKL